MQRQQPHEIDNRNSEEMYTYLESRIEALRRRIAELESENERLRWQVDRRNDARYLASA